MDEFYFSKGKRQVAIETQQYFQPEVEQGKSDPSFVKYMAHHPREFNDWKEDQEELKRIKRSY